MRQRLTIADIAAAAGVSMPTVSRVLNQRPDVSPETREHVLRVIAEHGYVSNRTTQPTKETATKLVDLIIPGPLDSEYYLEVIRGIDESLNRTGRRLALFTMYNEKRLEEDWQAHLAQRCPEGVLLLAPGEQFIYVEALRKLHIPFVVVDDSRELGPDVPSVGATNWRGGLMATEYLLSLGHRRIATISGIPSHLTSKARVAGYRSALETAGMTPEPELIRQGDFYHTSGYSQTLALLALPEPPTAIVAGCDIQATGIYRALSEHGMQVPHDMSIIGFDDIPSTEWMSPPLTTIRQPLREMGSIAVDLLFQQIAGEPLKSLRVELATSLVIRQSCAPIQLHTHREEQHMFEADFRITALVGSDGQGQRLFRVTEREAPANDAEFLSRLATMYQQEVYTTLQPGDDLTVAVRLDLPPREMERTTHLREDGLFEGEGLPQPTADPLPVMRAFYEPLMQRVKPGDVFTITFRVQRP